MLDMLDNQTICQFDPHASISVRAHNGGGHSYNDNVCAQYSAESNKRDMLEELTSHLVARPSNKTFLLHDLATCISAAIDADQVRPLARYVRHFG